MPFWVVLFVSIVNVTLCVILVHYVRLNANTKTICDVIWPYGSLCATLCDFACFHQIHSKPNGRIGFCTYTRKLVIFKTTWSAMLRLPSKQNFERRIYNFWSPTKNWKYCRVGWADFRSHPTQWPLHAPNPYGLRDEAEFTPCVSVGTWWLEPQGWYGLILNSPPPFFWRASLVSPPRQNTNTFVFCWVG